MKLHFIQKELFFRLLCLTASIWVIDQLCQKHLKSGKYSPWTFPLCLFFSQATLSLLWEAYGTDQIPYILLVLLKHVLFLGTVFLFFQSHAAKKLLTASVITAAVTLIANFCESFLSCLFLFALHTIWHVPAPVLGQAESIQILCICTAVILLVLWQLRIHLNLDVLFYDKNRKWYGILSAPLLGITAVIDISNWSASNGILVRSRADMGIYYDQIFSHSELCVLTALSMFAAGCYLFGMETICTEQQKSSQYHIQIRAFQILEQQYRQSERLRHDMKNHLIALSGLLKRGEWVKIEAYLKRMEQCVNLETGEENTGNSAVDALLYQKRKLAEDSHIRWECDVQVPPTCTIHEFDLCVLFGNLLDNALDACGKLSSERDRLIRIQAGPVKKCFLLEIKNHTDLKDMDKIQFRNKWSADGHGIGLLNVQDVLRKYDGTLHMALQDDFFIVSFLIPMELPPAYDRKTAF